MTTESDSEQTFLNELRKEFPNATPKFACALKMFGNSNPTMDRLKTNACLLSVMADLSVNANVETNDDKTEDGIHRSLAMFVRKTETGTGGEEMVKHHFAKDDAFFQTKLQETGYDAIWEQAEGCANWMDRNRHSHHTAKLYSKIWLNFIDWSCDVFDKMFSKEEVNSILKKTISRLLPMFKRVWSEEFPSRQQKCNRAWQQCV